MKEVAGEQINGVLRAVRAMSDDTEVQLSILGLAFVLACRSCGVDRELALENIETWFAKPNPLILPDQQQQ